MTQFTQLIMISSLWIWGVHLVFLPGQILESVGEVIRKLPKWIYKPTIGCPQCMSSIHGTLVYLIAHSFIHSGGYLTELLFIPFVICLAGLNHLITEFLYDTSI